MKLKIRVLNEKQKKTVIDNMAPSSIHYLPYPSTCNLRRDCKNETHFRDPTHFSSLTRPSYINNTNHTIILLAAFSYYYVASKIHEYPILSITPSLYFDNGIRHLMWFDGISTLFGAKRVSHQFRGTKLPMFPDPYSLRNIAGEIPI